jgi:DNA-binding response OmpR family regulator
MPDVDLKSVTVLLVDDEADDRQLVREALRSSGCTVLEADSFQRCIAVFERNQSAVQLLIADVSLEDGNGCDLALDLWQRKPDLRVLFVSGHVGAEVCRFYGLEVTDLHFLRKPFTARDLAARVRQVLIADQGFPTLCEPQKPRTSSMGSSE